MNKGKMYMRYIAVAENIVKLTTTTSPILHNVTHQPRIPYVLVLGAGGMGASP